MTGDTWRDMYQRGMPLGPSPGPVLAGSSVSACQVVDGASPSFAGSSQPTTTSGYRSVRVYRTLRVMSC